MKLLPKSIGKLENLETLDLKQSLVHEIPIEIKGLHKLRYLLAYHNDYEVDLHINRLKGVKIEKGIGQLKAVEKLYFIEASSVEFDFFKEISGLTEISEQRTSLCDCIHKLIHLESLDIASISEDDTVDFGSISSPPKFLQCLYLKGYLRKFPEWIVHLSSLTRLSIRWSKLEDDPMRALQNLPNLLELDISCDAYYGEHLRFVEGSFAKVKVLKLLDLSRLKSMVFEEGALSSVKKFYFGSSPELKEVPSGFQHLGNLKLLELWEMTTPFMMFQNFQSIQSIPEVQFICKFQGRLIGNAEIHR